MKTRNQTSQVGALNCENVGCVVASSLVNMIYFSNILGRPRVCVVVFLVIIVSSSIRKLVGSLKYAPTVQIDVMS